MTKHSFPGKTVNMVLACKVVTDHFTANISDLSKTRTSWTQEYASQLAGRVNTLGANLLGVRTRDELFDASRTLMSLITPAREKLSAVKTQINVDFRNDPVKRNNILTKLGFGKNSSHPSQTVLIAHLTTFKRNLTPELSSEITSAGLPANILTDIVNMAGSVDQANTLQETLKGSAKEGTDHMIGELNALYEEIIGICKIASNYYKNNPAKKEQFTFARILKNLGETQTRKETTVKA